MWKNLSRKLWKTVHQSYVFVALVSGVILGTILALIFQISFFGSPIWLILILMLFVYAFIRPNYFFVVVSLVAGMMLAGFRVSSELEGKKYIQSFIGQTVEVSGTIAEDVNYDESKTSLKLKNLKIGGMDTSGTIYVQLSSSDDSDLRRSDLVTFSGALSSGFGTYSASLYRPETIAHSSPEPGDLFLKARDWFAEKIRQFIPEEESSLGLAYLLGMKTGLSSDLMEILRVVGLTHIVVASGTHLGIIVSVFRKIFGKISRFCGLLFSILMIVIFASVIGWTASITRAAIVAILSLVAWYVGRRFEPWRLILIAMAITLMIDPMYLVNLGWLLSFASFSGILILGPEMTKFFYGAEKPHKVAEIIFSTISATLLCAPILIYYFGTLSLVSIVANVLILPTLPIVMASTFFTGIFSFLPFLASLIGKMTTFMLDYHLFVMKFFSEQTMFLVETSSGNAMIFLLYIPILAPFLIIFLQRYHKRKKLARL